ncbi:MAG TPA: hypothetical protein VJ572_05245 [Azonexus sp.]|nr:hypothetical protein [Azonexus sp.]
MKICLPTNDNIGLQSEVAANFSAAPWLLVVESDTGDILVIDATDTSQRDKPISMDLIMCRGMTEHLYHALRAQGVPIFGTRARSVAEALADFAEGNLRDLADQTCCKGPDAECDGNHVDQEPLQQEA